MTRRHGLVLAIALTAAACSREHRTPATARPHFSRTFSADRFQRGNLHAHTSVSDGDAPPAEVIGWYKAHAYAFVAITDHNVLTDPSRYGSLQGPGFTVIPGEEISMWAKGKQVHVNALCIHEVIAGGEFDTAKAALRTAVDRVREQGGVAIVNHPNFDWALDRDDVLAVAGSARLLEIASGHPYVHTEGDATHPSHEALWDDALAAGLDTMGVAVDDEHHIRVSADPPAFAGVGWVEVFADSPAPARICAALARGELYSSTGPALRSIRVTEQDYSVELGGPADAVEFVGDGGRLLARHERPAGAATYHLRGDERYVRARVRIGHETAWTPAVFVER